MSEDILVRRCAITVVRRDAGELWADRAANREIARKAQEVVLAALDDWLAPLLAARAAGSAVLKEVQIALTLDPADLAGPAPLLRTRLRAKLAEGFASAAIFPTAAAAQRSDATVAPVSEDRLPGTASPSAQDLSGYRQRSVLLQLAQACEDGWLGFQFTLLRGPALLALAASVLAEAGEPIASLAVSATRARRDQATAPLRTRDALQALRTALGGLALALILEKDGDTVKPASVKAGAAALTQVRRAALGLARALDSDETTDRAAGRAGADRPTLKPDKSSLRQRAEDAAKSVRIRHEMAEPAGAGTSRSLPHGRYACASLLPFLMLQPLARHRLFDGLVTEGEDALAWAQALAWMALGQTADGQALRQSARLFANSVDDLSGTRLLAMVRRGSLSLSMQAASCGALLLAGHGEGAPLLALPEAGGLLIVEREGLAPIALLDPDALADFAEVSTSPLFLPDAGRAALATLDAVGLGAFCSGAPGRGEVWQPVHGPHGWVGTTTMEPVRAAAAARHAVWLEDGIERSSAAWHSLYNAALPVPAAAEPSLMPLRAPLALLAGFALSEIGLALARLDSRAWADPDPLLAIERFASLSGDVVIEGACVRVVLPLGRRFIDLRDAGLLATLGGVPWWPGRRIEFTGG